MVNNEQVCGASFISLTEVNKGQSEVKSGAIQGILPGFAKPTFGELQLFICPVNHLATHLPCSPFH